MAQKNGRALTVKKGTKQADVLTLVADTLEESKAAGKSYFSKLVVVREEETGKVYLGKAFADRIDLFTASLSLPLVVKTSRGKISRAK